MLKQWLSPEFKRHAIWFIGSLALAFFVWVVANLQANPIQQEWFPQSLNVQVLTDEGMLITNTVRTVQVLIRAPSSVSSILSASEIEVMADMRGLPEGDYNIPLQVQLARPQALAVDIRPSVLHLNLERLAEKLVPLQANIRNETPADYTHDAPTFDLSLNEVTISGASSQVAKVVATQVDIDLTDQRNPLSLDATIYALDASGATVENVTLQPARVRVNINIQRREDVREIAVRPNIIGALPDGYVLSTLSYHPQSVIISGDPSDLTKLPDTLSTQPVDLAGRTASFVIEVPAVISANNLLLLSGSNITVSVEITPVAGSKQYNNVTVELLNLSEGLTARLSPNTVSVLLTGPQATLNDLTKADLRVVVDVKDLPSGNYTLKPTVSITQGELADENISVLPAEVNIEINAAATATATKPS